MDWTRVFDGVTTWVLQPLGYAKAEAGLCAVSLILTSLLLAGCSSAGPLSGIYVVSLRYRLDNSQSETVNSQIRNLTLSAARDASSVSGLEVRASYFSLCAVSAETGSQWQCAPDASTLNSLSSPTTDPLGLLGLARAVKDEVLFPGFFAVQIALLLIAITAFLSFPTWHEEEDFEFEGDIREVKPFPTKKQLIVAQFAAAGAIAVAFIAALWQHIAVVAVAQVLEQMAADVTVVKPGPAALALGWITVAVSLVVCIGIYTMRLSFRILATVFHAAQAPQSRASTS